MTAESARPISILIAALGGEGGGVLSTWLVEAATIAGFPVQSTSIPGVAQRTGATTYYVEIFPVPLAELKGREPVMTLTPGPGDIDLLVSHQANRRIILSAADRLGLDKNKVVINIERFGNTTAATIPLALADAVADGRLKKGARVLLTSVGAGFTAGAVLLRWAY